MAISQRESTANQGERGDDRGAVYEQERLILDATETIYSLMEAEGVNKTELASRIGRSKGYISQVLSGSRNLTLRTLAELGYALGYRLELHPKKCDERDDPLIATPNNCVVLFQSRGAHSLSMRCRSYRGHRVLGVSEAAFGRGLPAGVARAAGEFTAHSETVA